MSAVLENLYFVWLYDQIMPNRLRNPRRSRWLFAKQLYEKEFLWFIPNDDNRASDGLALRKEYINISGIEPSDDYMNLGCSMLELLIALARRMTWVMDGEADDFFWELITNIGLQHYSDEDYRSTESYYVDVDNALDKIIWRTYDYTGDNGGLFPLFEPATDQRKTEIWYQMHAYAMEKEGN